MLAAEKFNQFYYKKVAEARNRNMRILYENGWKLISSYAGSKQYHEFLNPIGEKVIYKMCYVIHKLSTNPEWSPKELGDDLKYNKNIKKVHKALFEKGRESTLQLFADNGWELLDEYMGTRHYHRCKNPDGEIIVCKLNGLKNNMKKNPNYRGRNSEERCYKTLQGSGYELLEPYKGTKYKHKIKCPDGNVMYVQLNHILYHLRLGQSPYKQKPLPQSYLDKYKEPKEEALQEINRVKCETTPKPTLKKPADIIVSIEKTETRECLKCRTQFKCKQFDDWRICHKCRKYKYG